MCVSEAYFCDSGLELDIFTVNLQVWILSVWAVIIRGHSTINFIGTSYLSANYSPDDFWSLLYPMLQEY